MPQAWLGSDVLHERRRILLLASRHRPSWPRSCPVAKSWCQSWFLAAPSQISMWTFWPADRQMLGKCAICTTSMVPSGSRSAAREVDGVVVTSVVVVARVVVGGGVVVTCGVVVVGTSVVVAASAVVVAASVVVVAASVVVVACTVVVACACVVAEYLSMSGLSNHLCSSLDVSHGCMLMLVLSAARQTSPLFTCWLTCALPAS
mmetsp:Transcript_4487/g.13166  ORF Transcript_4487/g.13166 Transcript_4487/m.13166 type:complete len:204 (+) Transcript_4487:381-992(+)